MKKRNAVVWIITALLLPLFAYGWKMESDTITLPATVSGSTTWQHIAFKQTYDTTPLVFALVDEGSGYNGDTPVIIRVKNVTTTGCDMVQVEASSVAEPASDQGPHPAVNVHYLVIEPGDHLLPDGTRILAETRNIKAKQGKNSQGADSWVTINLSPAFSTTPVVLAMIQTTVNESAAIPGVASTPWLTTTIRKNISSGQFRVALERAETQGSALSQNETVAYMVVDSGIQGSLFDTQTCDTIAYETIRTSDSVIGWDNSGGCKAFSFSGSYTNPPLVIGHQNSRDGNDGGWLRRCALDATSVGLTIDEDQAKDNERRHTSEIAGLMIFEKPFVFDSVHTLSCRKPIAEYRHDACYWLGGSVADIEERQNGYNAVAMNGADTFTPVSSSQYATLCRAGTITGGAYAAIDTPFSLGQNWTLSVWVKFPIPDTSQAYHILGSFTGTGDLPIFDFINYPDIKWAVYDNSGSYQTKDFNDTLSGWHHFVFVNDGNAGETRLYLDGQYHSRINLTTSGTLEVLYTSTDGYDTQNLDTDADEFKLWDAILSDNEIDMLYQNEKAGKNYDGSVRTCPTCKATATAGIWGLIGIPGDLRTASAKEVADIFDEFPAGSYNQPNNSDGWVVYKRVYSTTNNSSGYTVVPYTGEDLQFGQGYWLATKATTQWSENGTPSVEYNATDAACTANQCVKIDLTPVTLNFGAPDYDTNDGSGHNRNNMLGFIGHKPVNWADCRFVIDGTAYTPSDAEAAGYADKQIWQYNPGASGANANGYTTCDDTTPGGCKLEPYKGFWVILHGPTKGKSVKLLIPKE